MKNVTNKLNTKEQMTLRLLAQEKTTSEMATEIGVSIFEVEEIIQEMIRKFATKSEVGLIKIAIKTGLIINE
jgi:DNA-binding CsgD family transcriptional regulator